MSSVGAETYPELTLVDIQNNQFVLNNVFRDMTVGRFKRAVGIKARLPQTSWDDLRLHLGDVELADERTLEFYNLDVDSLIHFVTSTPQPRARHAPTDDALELSASLPTSTIPRKTFDNIFVRSTNDGKTFTFNHVPRDELVKDFRNRVAERLGSEDEARFIRLIYVKQLEDHNNLMFYNIQNGSTIEMVMRLEGGCARE